MKQKINLTQQQLDEIATKATKLSDWLEDKSLSLACRTAVPPQMTIVGAYVVAAGMLVMMDGAIPDGGCWATKSGCFI
jgi:hypothetical protein